MKANDAILKNMQTNMTSLTNSILELKNMFGQFIKMNTASSSGSGTLPGNTITNPNEDLKGTEDVQPPVVPTESLILNSEPVISPIIEHVASPVSASRPNPKPSIPYLSRLQDQKLRDKFGPSIKSLLTNKDKLCELARTPLNKHCSAVLLKKFPEKLEDPGKFLIPCDFPVMVECLALADLGASINLMLLSVWNKLSLPDLSPMCMTLELVDRSISRSVGVVEDVFVKVGELTLCVGKEAITFNLDQILRYSAYYNDMTAKRIDVIDMACEEYSQEVLGLLIDFLLEEVDAFLALEDDPTSPEVDQSYLDSERDM
uniref:Reverse transcriptase domain-containing protein n=1 Tax=Tanacetum cinerariifolium TaxID=118510 RepID=A0A6L2M9N1_TANCI|nr:hypothetical protein [Tanacetum cinerariifolium]